MKILKKVKKDVKTGIECFVGSGWEPTKGRLF